MNLDIRFPLGLLFSVIGLILAVAGMVTDERSLGYNINLWWGLVLLAFGASMLLLAGRATRGRGDR